MNSIGFDDAPFPHEHRGDVAIYGTVCAGTRLDGVLRSKVRRDGTNATDRIARLFEETRFREHTRLLLLQGIAVAGFNVVDLDTLHGRVGIPVLVVARRMPRLEAMRAALRSVPGGARKWSLIERAGPMEALGGVFVQRRGLSREQAGRALAATTLHGNLPEPLRLAHLIAGGVTTGISRGRA